MARQQVVAATALASVAVLDDNLRRHHICERLAPRPLSSHANKHNAVTFWQSCRHRNVRTLSLHVHVATNLCEGLAVRQFARKLTSRRLLGMCDIAHPRSHAVTPLEPISSGSRDYVQQTNHPFVPPQASPTNT